MGKITKNWKWTYEIRVCLIQRPYAISWRKKNGKGCVGWCVLSMPPWKRKVGEPEKRRMSAYALVGNSQNFPCFFFNEFPVCETSINFMAVCESPIHSHTRWLVVEPCAVTVLSAFNNSWLQTTPALRSLSAWRILIYVCVSGAYFAGRKLLFWLLGVLTATFAFLAAERWKLQTCLFYRNSSAPQLLGHGIVQATLPASHLSV